MYRILPLMFLIAACGNSSGVERNVQKPSKKVSAAPVSPKDRTPEAPQEFALRVLKAIKYSKYKELSSMFYEEGVKFSPDAYISEEDVTLSPESFVKAWEKDSVFVWGVQPGSGMPIKMGIREYFKRYVYDRDYLNAPKVATNRRIGKSNTKNNIKEVYPDAVFVEFHFPGTEENGGMDWSSLRVVLKKSENWKVIALVHDNWTP